MRSGTSCFNPTVFKKTIARFWPLWAAYAGAWFLILPLRITATRGWSEADSLYFDLEQSILNSASRMSPFVCAVMAILTAMAVFGWLYSPRSAGFTAALPVKRESMFLSCFAAGLAMILAGNVLTFLFSWVFALSRGAACTIALLQWLAVVCMDSLSFYGFAALCAMLTGNLLILPLVYAALQFAEVTVENLADYLVSCISFGYTQSSSYLSFLSPLWTRARNVRTVAELHENALGNTVVEGFHLEGWGVVIGYAAAGLAFAGLALWLYKRRRMETASDTVAVRQLKPVFRWCLAVGCALCLAAGVNTILIGGYTAGTWAHTLRLLAMLLLGALIGWLGADMLIYKTFRVLRLHPKGLALLVAVLCALTVSCELDAFGIERKIPASFERVYIETNGEQLSLAGEEAKTAVRALHESIVADKAVHEAAQSLRGLTIEYYGSAQDGRETLLLRRNYRIAEDETQQADSGSDLRALERLCNLRESIDYRKEVPFAVTAENIDYGVVEYGIDGRFVPAKESAATQDEAREPLRLTQDEAWELYSECVLPDIAEGTLGRIWLVQDEAYRRTVYCCTIHLEFSTRTEDGRHNYDYFYTVPTVDSTRTNAWLAAHGVELLTVAEFEKEYYPQ